MNTLQEDISSGHIRSPQSCHCSHPRTLLIGTWKCLHPRPCSAFLLHLRDEPHVCQDTLWGGVDSCVSSLKHFYLRLLLFLLLLSSFPSNSSYSSLLSFFTFFYFRFNPWLWCSSVVPLLCCVAWEAASFIQQMTVNKVQTCPDAFFTLVRKETRKLMIAIPCSKGCNRSKRGTSTHSGSPTQCSGWEKIRKTFQRSWQCGEPQTRCSSSNVAFPLPLLSYTLVPA